MIKIIKAVTLDGHLNLLAREIIRRFHSDNTFYVFRRDLSTGLVEYVADIPLSLRPVTPADIRTLLDLRSPPLNSNEVMERLRLSRLIKSDIQTCYVAVTQDNVPCHMGWLIQASDNDKLEGLFGGGIPPLADDEVLFEGGFTLEKYRRKGVQRWVVSKFLEKATELGARWVLSFVRSSNTPSLRTNQRTGFVTYLRRDDKWRFFRRTIVFSMLDEIYPVSTVTHRD
jgi:GNAT superfamily N-acetyltransferase